MDDDLFVVEKIDANRSICVSTLARKTVEEADVTHLGGYGGYFIYEVDESQKGGVSVLAKAASLEAAFRLVDLWRDRRTQHITV